jgi:nucleoside 2-deoxyribosyltransferase
MKIYLAGSIAGGREFEKNIQLIASIIEEEGYEVLTKTNVVNINPDDAKAATLNDRQFIFNRDKKWLEESDLVIIEASQSSHGVGFEHATAEKLKKPILVLRHSSLEGQRMSAFLDGTGYEKSEFHFYDEKNIKKILEEFLERYSSNPA